MIVISPVHPRLIVSRLTCLSAKARLRWIVGPLEFIVALTMLSATSAGGAPPILPDEQLALRVPMDDPEAAFRLLARRFHDNHSRIHAWSGTFRITDHTSVQGDALQHLRQVANQPVGATAKATKVDALRGEFVTDFDHDRVFTTLEQAGPSELIDPAETIEMPHLVAQRSVVTPEHFLHLNPLQEHGAFMGLEGWHPEITGRAAFRDPAYRTQNEDFGTVVNPRWLFWLQSGKMTYGEYFQFWADRLSGSEMESDFRRQFAVHRIAGDAGNLYHVLVAGHQEFLVDADTGHNVTVMLQYDPGSKRKISDRRTQFTRDEATDIWVPSVASLTVYNEDGETEKFRRDWILDESVLNPPLNDRMFTYQQLGLRDGERVIDRIDRIGYVYRGGELVDAQKYDPSEPMNPHGNPVPTDERRSLWVIVAANLVVILALYAIFSWRRRQPRSAS